MYHFCAHYIYGKKMIPSKFPSFFSVFQHNSPSSDDSSDYSHDSDMERTERPHKKSSSSSYRDYDSSFSQVGSLKLIPHVFIEVTFQKYNYKQCGFGSLGLSQCLFSWISGSSSSSHLPEEIPRCKAGSVVENKPETNFFSIRQQIKVS